MRLFTSLFLALLVTGCSSSPSLTSSSSRSVGPSVQSTLPGESVEDAFERTLYACMDSFGEIDYEESKSVSNGVPRTTRGYHLTNSVSKGHHTDCMSRAERAMGAPEPTSQDWIAAHANVARIVECLRGRGFDMGTTVSLQAFEAARGDIAFSSSWPALSQQQDFEPAFEMCAA
jgi:hypothetical protein